MTDRQEHILAFVIEEYIRTAEPIGSKQIVDIGKFDLSGATVRNELHDLEMAGFLTHPHTSAGRIPTEAGYQYYVDRMEASTSLPPQIEEQMKKIIDAVDDPEQKMKMAGKVAAEVTRNAVIIAFGPDKIYYTGISYLFSQKEFQDVQHTIRVSTIFDHCEEYITQLFQDIDDQPKIFIGSQNPLGSVCSTVASRVNEHILFAILGPIRMDYVRSQSVVNLMREMFS